MGFTVRPMMAPVLPAMMPILRTVIRPVLRIHVLIVLLIVLLVAWQGDGSINLSWHIDHLTALRAIVPGVAVVLVGMILMFAMLVSNCKSD